MTVRITFDGKKVSKDWAAKVGRYSEAQIVAVQKAVRRTAENIEIRGRQDIRESGDFGSNRWQQGFRAFVSYASRLNLRIRVTHAVRYWRVFEYGARILGRPLLWIPLSFARGVRGVRARDYPGQLFRVDRRGRAPLLLARTGGGQAEPKYFGKRSVRIPRKWHLRRIVHLEVRRMNIYYREALRQRNG